MREYGAGTRGQPVDVAPGVDPPHGLTQAPLERRSPPRLKASALPLHQTPKYAQTAKSRLGKDVASMEKSRDPHDGSIIHMVVPCRENCVPAQQNSVQACTPLAVSKSRRSEARASRRGGGPRLGGRHVACSLFPPKWMEGAVTCCQGRADEADAVHSGWRAAPPAIHAVGKGDK